MPIERPTFHESWYRVADLHPRLNSRLQISRQHFRGQRWFVVQDHTNNAFFRLAEPAYRFVGLLDGRRSVGEAWKIANDQLGDDAPTQGEVIQLLGQLYTSNLLHAEVPADTHTLFARYKKRKQREISGYLMNIMFARIPLIDPDGFLNRWISLLGWMFSPVGLVLWLMVIATGAYFIAQVPNWPAKLASPVGGMLSPDNLIGLYIAFAFIKACHEMGHAISCKKFGRQSGTGGEVHVIGIMFLVFTPVPYVDASSSWALTSKWRRAIVGAAGMWVELAIASIAAVVWSQTSEAHWLHAFSYNIMFVASFSTVVFNANPLLRYDGYYILSDLLEIPNLAQRGKEYLYYLVKRYVWKIRHARNPSHGRSERFWLFTYAIASFLMRVFVTFSIMFYLTSVLEGALIILATAMALAGLLTWVLVPLGKFLHYLASSQELARTRTRAVTTSALTVALLVILLGFVPIPDYARAQGVVEPARQNVKDLFAESSGFVTQMNIEGRQGAGGALAKRLGSPFVGAGDVLLRAENPEMSAELEQAQAELERARVELRIVMASNPDARAAAEVAIESWEERIALLRRDMQKLVLHAPISGALVPLDLEERRFAYVKRGDRLAMVADTRGLIVRAATANEHYDGIFNEAQRDLVEIRVNGRPDILLTGRVFQMPEAGGRKLPSPALGFQMSGDLNTTPDDEQGLTTVESFFEVRLDQLRLKSAPRRVEDEFNATGDLPLLPGQRVVVRFTLHPKPIATQVWTRLQQMFQRKFQT